MKDKKIMTGTKCFALSQENNNGLLVGIRMICGPISTYDNNWVVIRNEKSDHNSLVRKEFVFETSQEALAAWRKFIENEIINIEKAAQ